jgi:serine/threonine-protein kinase RsbT
MAIVVVNRTEVPIATENDVVTVRRNVRQLAHERGLDNFATAGITTAASELARNVFVHARGGTAVIEEVSDVPRIGIRLELRDTGPGIADLDRALAGGFSTARSLGLGLSGSRRLVDEFAIDSVVGRGTVVIVTKWKRF